MVLWDNNIYNNDASGSNGECHMYIDRNSLQWKDPEIISTIMKHVDGTPATVNGQTITPDPEPQPSAGLKAEYSVVNWGSGFQVLIKVKNDSATKVDGWTVKISKNDVKNIDNCWCVNIAEQGDYYVITPMSWNSTLEPGGSAVFGIQGSGSVGENISCIVE